MKRHLAFTNEPIDEPSLVAERNASGDMGAAVCFSGIVRWREGAATIKGLDYEAFREMAERQFHLIFDQVQGRWPIESIRVIHRLGRVEAGVASLWVEVVGPHRGESFAACQFVIDEMKRLVPIWKKPIL